MGSCTSRDRFSCLFKTQRWPMDMGRTYCLHFSAWQTCPVFLWETAAWEEVVTSLYILCATSTFHLHSKSQDWDFPIYQKALKFTLLVPSCKNQKLKCSSVCLTRLVASKLASEWGLCPTAVTRKASVGSRHDPKNFSLHLTLSKADPKRKKSSHICTAKTQRVQQTSVPGAH